LGNCGPTDQCSSFYTCPDDLHLTATSRVVYVDDNFLHEVPKKIVSDRGTQFTSKFWERLHETLDAQLNFSSAYRPQTDGQTERVNHTLEDMLRACALQYG
jgi:transposase InsO family protein